MLINKKISKIMTTQEYKEMFKRIIEYHWKGTDAYQKLSEIALDDKKLSKMLSLARRIEYAYHIDLHDATNSLISEGKFYNI